jgi:hypothetical protein
MIRTTGGSGSRPPAGVGPSVSTEKVPTVIAAISDQIMRVSLAPALPRPPSKHRTPEWWWQLTDVIVVAGAGMVASLLPVHRATTN